jgi:anion-transporting  ArsA/GET3 family ATPase
MTPPQQPKSSLVCILGSGGVGKTTSAAAIAIALAQQGKKVVVITVDPARRLAQVLGLDSLSNDAKKVISHNNGGELWALWLDANKALDDLVKKHASRLSSVDKVLNNRLFKIIQSQLGGVEEYLGVEKVLALGKSGHFDVCVLDTPPSRHAIDFLESPRHILKFFDESVLKVFLKDDEIEKNTGFIKKLFKSSKQQVLEVFKGFLGKTFLHELSELLQNLVPIRQIFMEAAQEIEDWVRQPNVYFALVGTLEPYPIDEIRLLQIEMSARNLPPPSLYILNKCLPTHEPNWEHLQKISGNESAHFFKATMTKQTKLRNEFAGFTDSSSVVAEVPRYSVTQFTQKQLTEMGLGITSKWQSKNPKTFF